MKFKGKFCTFLMLACAFQAYPQANDKVVSVYLLLNSSKQLQHYVNDLAKIKKPNFNRIIFSFVRPTLTDYLPNSLASTGLMGYISAHDGKGVQAFNALKAAIKLSKEKNIQTFLAVGGRNFSCNFNVVHEACGPASSDANPVAYDWFPDPTNPEEAGKATTSYANLIKLASDLGIEGIDFDYDEFWHANKYAITWAPSSKGEWSTDIAKSIIKAGGPTYNNLMHYGTNSGVSFVMPKTIDKVEAILHSIMDDPGAKYLKFTAAVTPVGARPITGFISKEKFPNINSEGGLWWKGNLKGLWYNLIDKNPAIASRFETLGLMTYDLCGDNPKTCPPYPNGPLDLPQQVNAYMKEYINWIKTDHPSSASLTIDDAGKVTFLPAKYLINAKLQFGFEVNQPAYPPKRRGQLQLTNQLVNKILSQQKDSGGVIIWQMYSRPNSAVPDATTVKYTINQSCKVFLANDTRYDCNADFPGNG
jgi:hypothetical protein